MISFVVPAHNEASLIAATLDSIRDAATAVGVPFDVSVAVDASTDATAKIAEERGARVLLVDHRQIAATRNSGAAASTGEWLVFVDADTLIDEAVLRAAIEALRAGAVGGGARIAFDGDVPLSAWLVAKTFEPVYFALRLAAGCFVFCTREAFDRAGGFDEQLYASEEITLSRELKKLGRFVVLKQRVQTSARKLRTHSLGEMLGPLFALVFRGQKAFSKREGLDLWYGPRRER